MLAGATKPEGGGVSTLMPTERRALTAWESRNRSSSSTAEKAAVFWLSESKRTAAMSSPVNSKDLAGTDWALKMRGSEIEAISTPLVSSAVAVHAGWEITPDWLERPTRVKLKARIGLARPSVKLTG